MIVLDTHVWVWFVSNPELISDRALEIIKKCRDTGSIFISSISAWEVAILVKNNRLHLKLQVGDWVAKLESIPFFRFVSVDNAIAVKSVGLPPPLHRDPADRIIIATALTLGASIVTKDEKIRTYGHVKTIW